MPPRDVLRLFIDDLLTDMKAEAIDLKTETNFREAAMLLERCLFVYFQYVYPMNLQTPEDEKHVIDIRILMATLFVFSGIFQKANDAAKEVVETINVTDEMRREAQLIVSVAKAGIDLLKFRAKSLSKIILERRQRILHRLNGTEQEALLNFMIKELEKELGPYNDTSAPEVNNSETPHDMAWVPEHNKKFQEKVVTTSKQKKKKKRR